jgi:transcriptional regulator with XRE-family HTH domain
VLSFQPCYVARQKQYRNIEVVTKLGLKIREIRLQRGFSQEQLANLCDLELSQINRIELGKINTSVSHLFLIASKLGVDVTELVKLK